MGRKTLEKGEAALIGKKGAVALWAKLTPEARAKRMKMIRLKGLERSTARKSKAG